MKKPGGRAGNRAPPVSSYRIKQVSGEAEAE